MKKLKLQNLYANKCSLGGGGIYYLIPFLVLMCSKTKMEFFEFHLFACHKKECEVWQYYI